MGSRSMPDVGGADLRCFRLVRRLALSVGLASALLASAPVLALSEQRGQTASGAYFIAQAPDGWHAGGTLVLVNHGYHIDPPDDEPSLGPSVLRQRMLARGYAVAASSYSQRGWALFGTERDQREMVAAFAARFGQPGAIIASGGSLGGLVTMQQAEQADLGVPVVGAGTPRNGGWVLNCGCRRRDRRSCVCETRHIVGSRAGREN